MENAKCYCYEIQENGFIAVYFKSSTLNQMLPQREYERAMLAQKDETTAELDTLVQ